MSQRPNPFANLLLILGAGLCIAGAGYDGADGLFRYPTTLITVMAGLAIVLAIAGLLGAGRGADGLGVVFGLLLAGYVANTVTLTLYFTHTFEGAVVFITLGSAILIIAASLALYELVRVRTPQGRTASFAQRSAGVHASEQPTGVLAAQQAAVAPAGWYPDPAGGSGQRYWDGAAWGQTHP